MVEFSTDYKDVSSSDMLQDMINHRKRVTSVLSSHRNILNNVIPWFPVVDDSAERIVQLDLSSVPTMTMSTLTGLHRYTFEQSSCPHIKSILKINKPQEILKTSILQFQDSDIQYPAAWPSKSYPTAETVKNYINGRQVFISFYSVHGYDFSSEFEHVYSAESNYASVFDDVAAVCKRAIAAADPAMTLSAMDLDVLADYVLRMALWEIGVGDVVAAATLASQCPLLDAMIVPPQQAMQQQGHHIRVYIGYNPSSSSATTSASPSSSSSSSETKPKQPMKHEMCFWIRTLPRLTYNTTKDFKAKRTVCLREAFAEGHGSVNADDEMDIDIVNGVVRICYVRRYNLDVAVAKAMGCIPLASFSMSTDGKIWLDQNKQHYPDSSNSQYGDTDTTSLTDVYTKTISWFLPEQPEKSLDGTLFSKSLTKPRPPGDMSAAIDACTLYFVFTQLPSLDPDKEVASTNNDDVDTTVPPVNGDIVNNNTNNNTKKRKDISLQPVADIERLRTLGTQILHSPSSCADLLGWGQNTAHNLGFGPLYDEDDNFNDTNKSGIKPGDAKSDEHSIMPLSIPMHPLMMMERVKMIACSPKHTLLLSFHGSLFSCGENSEGALGLGDLYSRPGFTRITFIAGRSRITADDSQDIVDSNVLDPEGEGGGDVRIVKISAGSSSVGSHSAALDSQGQIYMWGVAYAIGMGTVKPVLEPSLLQTFHLDDVEKTHQRKWQRMQTRRQRKKSANETQGGSNNPVQSSSSSRIDDINEIDDEDEDDEEEEEGTGRTDGVYGQIPTNAPLGTDIGLFGSIPCIDVACGGGFTVVVTRSRRVASFGTWSHGRLGLGPIPIVKRRRGGGDSENTPHERNGSGKLARYQLRPLYIAGLTGVKSVACGEAHTLCVMENGELYAWGQNTCGQVGDGPVESGLLSDRDVPVIIHPFSAMPKGDIPLNHPYTPSPTASTTHAIDSSSVHPSSSSYQREYATKAFAGSYHSIIIDQAGAVWTWGARGSPCLGHGDIVSLQGSWANKINAVFAASTTQTKVMVPYELRDWCEQWSKPRKLSSLTHGDHRVVQVSAGDLHTAFLTSNGRLYLCGSGPVVPPFFSESDVRQQGSKRSKDNHKNKTTTTSKKKNTSKRKKNEDTSTGEVEDGDDHEEEEQEEEEEEQKDYDLAISSASIVTLPRKPSASWLSSLSAKSVLLVAGSGTRCFVLLDEELVSTSVTARLMRNLLFGGVKGGSDTAEGVILDDVSLDSLARSEASSMRGKMLHAEQKKAFYFEQRGGADCMLIASGKILLAHRAILSQRSPQLREMIAMETESAVDSDGLSFDLSDDISSIGEIPGTQHVVKLLLPEIHSDVAKALLCYLYTDVLPHDCIGNTFMLRSLQRVGHSLRIPRLQMIAESLLEALSYVELELLVTQEGTNAVGTRDFVEKIGANAAMEMPPSTLARDMGSLLGEPLFADVRFIAEGRHVMAHKFLLESRSVYFRALFRSGMNEMSTAVMSSRNVPGGMRRKSRKSSIIEISVPDTFVGFLRLLLFIYTDTLPDGSDDALLEDLLSADRYGLDDMKDLCESMLMPSKSNWFNLLRAAELVNSTKLMNLTMNYLQDNFAVLLEGMVQVDMIENGMENETADVIDHPIPTITTSSQVSYITFLQSEFPDLLNKLLEQRKKSFPLPPSQVILRHLKEGSRLKSQLSNGKGEHFPWWALITMAVCSMLYPTIANTIVLGNWIIYINVAFTLGVLLYTSGIFRGRAAGYR